LRILPAKEAARLLELTHLYQPLASDEPLHCDVWYQVAATFVQHTILPRLPRELATASPSITGETAVQGGERSDGQVRLRPSILGERLSSRLYGTPVAAGEPEYPVQPGQPGP
jgi:hypothetical protein